MPPVTTHQNLWTANEPDLFHWSEWENEEESVLFHKGSGETLLLNPLGAFLLKAVSEKPMSIDELVQHAASFFRTTVDEELIQMVATSLYTFKAKGLVVSIAS